MQILFPSCRMEEKKLFIFNDLAPGVRDTVCFEDGYLAWAAELLGPDRLVLGSDGPFPLGEPDPVGFVRRAFGDGPAGADILHRNAATMFGLAGQEAETWKRMTTG